jgi:MYXO-CTERM domain-containing protein
MWVNPVSEASTSVTASGGAVMGTFLSQLSLRQAFNNGGVSGGPGVPNTQILIDAAAIGDSFADVFGSLVPEPTSGTLGLASVALLAVRRRRR